MPKRLFVSCVLLFSWFSGLVSADGNRLAYLSEPCDPFYVNRAFPRLITPQWVGQAGVEGVIVLSIDDMRDPQHYEQFLRPILERLKKIDGRAPLSILTNAIHADDPQLQSWLEEGLSLEVHTVDHPCPCLRDGNFDAARSTYDRCVDLMWAIPGNRPVAFRMPCCDSINSTSPRFWTEVFNRPTPEETTCRLTVRSFMFSHLPIPRYQRRWPHDPMENLAFDITFPFHHSSIRSKIIRIPTS